MTSPDLTQYVDLRVYDKDPEDIFDAAIAVLQTNLPEWEPADTQVEVMLLQALAVEVADAVFAVNRLPSALVEVLLGLYGTTRGEGTPPQADVTFTMADTAGYEVPAGTQVALTVPGSSVVLTFTTDTLLNVIAGNLTGTVAATATTSTDIANGTPAGTVLELLSPVEQVSSVTLAGDVAGGTNPETLSAFLTRGTARLARLSDTLIAPAHFTTRALEEYYVSRATTLDNYNPAVGPSAGSNGGHIAVYVYGVGGLLTSAQKTTLHDTLDPMAAANLAVHIEDPTFYDIDVVAEVVAAAGFTEAEVRASVDAALATYFDPATWPWKGAVYVNELIALVDGVTGVDRVVAIRRPSTDLSLASEDTVLVSLRASNVTFTGSGAVSLGVVPVAATATIPTPTVTVP